MNCYLCGSNNVGFRDGAARDVNDILIRECNDCNLVFLENSPAAHPEYYQDSKMHEDACCTDDVHAWLVSSEQNDSRRFDMLRESIIGKKILDFGCGAGGFIERAKDVAKIVHGLEVERKLEQYYSDKKYTVFSSVDELQPKFYEFITLFHVLEHLTDPRKILIELKDKITANGRVIIEVPAANDALLTLYDSKEYKKFIYWSCHLYLFTRHTLSKLAEQSGFSVDYITEFQRYSLSNHLYWLSKGRPGGQKEWWFLEDPHLKSIYDLHLAKLGVSDTLIMGLSLKPDDANLNKGCL